VRAGAGLLGADRVVLTWANGAISKQWLEVIVLANPNTGLAQKAGYPAGQGDVFYFGHALADTGAGNTATQANVSISDELGARNHPASLFNNIPITNIYDFNRDGQVNLTDILRARNNPTSINNVTRFISLSNPPTAPETSVATDNGGVASALSAPTSAGSATSPGAPSWLAARVPTALAETRASTKYVELTSVQSNSNPRRQPPAATIVGIESVLDLDPLELLWADLGL